MTLTAKQLIERQDYLGGSESAAALGLSPYFTRLQLFMAKMGTGEPIETTIPMMVGTALEPICLELFERETGLAVNLRQRIFIDPRNPWRRCTIDGYVHSEHAIVEAKTSGDFRGWGDGGTDEIPLPYLYNIMHSFLCVPEARKAFFPVLIGGRTYKTYEVNRDEMLERLVDKGEQDFREKYWLAALPPPPTNLEDLKILYPRDTGRKVEATPPILAQVEMLAAIKKRRKDAEKEESEFVFRIKEFMGDAATLVDYKGNALCTLNTSESERIDVKALRAKAPDIAAQFTKSGTTRTLLVKI